MPKSHGFYFSCAWLHVLCRGTLNSCIYILGETARLSFKRRGEVRDCFAASSSEGGVGTPKAWYSDSAGRRGRTESRWCHDTFPPPQKCLQVTSHTSNCDDMSVPYGAELFASTRTHTCSPRRSCTESDFNDCAILVHIQMQKKEPAVGKWWGCLIITVSK